jgi:hypothetical protein
VAGLSYEKSGLSNRVNPIFFPGNDHEDLDRLVDIFFGYVFEADNPAWWFEELRPEDRYRSKAKLALDNGKKHRKKLLRAWWDQVKPVR